MEYRFRPLVSWPGPETRNRGPARFRSGYADTLELLERELEHLRARDVVLEVDLQPSDIRLDGRPRANARWGANPGVVLSFHSGMHGPLRYPCDTYDRWQDNLRGIALALQALRAVDRYGVTRRGEQYRGWGALPPAGGSTAGMSRQDAAELLAEETGLEAEDLLHDTGVAAKAWRRAAARNHPDAGGDPARFEVLARARDALGLS